MSADRRLVHVFPSFAAGGSSVRTVNVIHALPEGFRHTVLATSGELGAREFLKPGAPVAFEPAPRRTRGGVDRAALRARLRALRPDLVLTYNWGAVDAIAAAAWPRIAPVLHAEDGFGPDEAAGQKARRVWARRALLRFVEAVVVPSRGLERIARGTWWVPASRLVYLPNGVDVARFSPGDGAPFRASIGVPPGAFLVGLVANLRGEKNPGRLLRAFAALRSPDAHLLFVGGGPDRPALERLAAELGAAERVRFAGVLPDPVGAYRAMDVFALSSDTEQMPISVLEAMGCGRPVLSTDVGDTKSMVAPANAPFVTPLGDEAAYAAALERLAGDAAVRRALGDANRARCVADFTIDRQNREYLELYERAMTRPTAR